MLILKKMKLYLNDWGLVGINFFNNVYVWRLEVLVLVNLLLLISDCGLVGNILVYNVCI